MSITCLDQIAPSTPVVSLLTCGCCGHTAELREDELVRFVQTGWPTCCGQVMTLPSAGRRPAPVRE
jgi:hypothetical protein